MIPVYLSCWNEGNLLILPVAVGTFPAHQSTPRQEVTSANVRCYAACVSFETLLRSELVFSKQNPQFLKQRERGRGGDR